MNFTIPVSVKEESRAKTAHAAPHTHVEPFSRASHFGLIAVAEILAQGFMQLFDYLKLSNYTGVYSALDTSAAARILTFIAFAFALGAAVVLLDAVNRFERWEKEHTSEQAKE